MNRCWIILIIVVCVGVSVFLVSASHSQEKPLKTDLAVKPPQPKTLSIVTDSDHFYRIIQESGPALVLFDFYADCCLPCKMLEPILADLAGEFQSRILAYRFNVETHTNLAAEVGVGSLPRNGEILRP